VKILLAPDKFKGTLSAKEVCEALARGLSTNPDHEIRQLPLADGGEGTQEFFLNHWNGKRIEVSVHDPLMRPFRAEFILSLDGKSAFIEMAAASGLLLLSSTERNPMSTTTFGTGELVRHALDQGVDEVYLGIGGSATNDAGLGMLCAMGARMLDKSGNEFIPRGETLGRIQKIDLTVLHPRASQVKFTALCDVKNPFYGEHGAAFVYAPQKGATPEHVQKLDAGLKHVALIIQKQTGIDLQKISGSGAGGGIASGLHALLHANLKRGIDVVFEIVKFKEAVQWADIVITGEGKVDEQTWQGKVVSGVITQAGAFNKRVIIVCGQHDLNVEGETGELPGVQFISIYSLSSIFGTTRAMEDTRATLTELVHKMQLAE
jgi:glycerate 2-kinase